MMRLHSLLLAIFGVTLLAACSSSEPSAPPPPPTDHIGTYKLTSVIGEPLPAVVMRQLTYNFQRLFTAGQLTLDANDDYTVQISFRDVGETSGAVIDTGTEVETGHYTRTADSVQFSDWNEEARDTISSGALGPIILRTGKLGLPQLDADVFLFTATFEKQ